MNVEIYSMHHLLHMGRKLRAEDDPLSDMPELAHRFRELSRRHHENGDEEPRNGHVNHGVVAVFGLLARRFLCLDSNGETYTVPVRPSDGQPVRIRSGFITHKLHILYTTRYAHNFRFRKIFDSFEALRAAHER